MRIAEVTQAELHFVVANMRERNRAEMAALFGSQYEAVVLQRFDAANAYCIATEDGPVAVFSISEPRRGVTSVTSVGLFATDAFPAVALRATHFLARRLFPALRERSHRIECVSLGAFEDTRKWLGAFGLRPEATLHAYGCNGEDFTVFAWTREGGAVSVGRGM